MRLKQSTAWLPLRRRHWILPLLVNSGVLLSLPAAAQEADVLRPYVGVSMTHDDNILGASNDAIAAGTASSISDTSRRLEVGLLVDKTISRQHLTANINFNRTSFNRLDNLDYNGRDIQANWNWRAGDQVQGNVGVTNSRTLGSVQESLIASGLLLQVPSLRTQEREYFDASWLFHPSWRVRGGVSHYKLNYDAASQQFANNTVNDGEIGVDYLARSGSTAGVVVRHANGDYPLSTASSYRQDEFKGRVDWKYSGKTDLQFLAGWVKRDLPNAPVQGYSGFNGRANAVWRATGKTTINVGLWREIGTLDDRSAAFSLNRGASIGAGWEISVKTRLDAFYQHENRDYSAANLARKDTVNYESLMLTWYPTRHLRVQGSLYQTVQSSDAAFVAYRNRGGILSTRYEF